MNYCNESSIFRKPKEVIYSVVLIGSFPPPMGDAPLLFVLYHYVKARLLLLR